NKSKSIICPVNGLFLMGHYLFGIKAVCKIYGCSSIGRHQAIPRRLLLCYFLFNKGIFVAQKKGMDTDPCSCRVKFFIEQWINNLEREIYFCRTCGDHRCDISFVVGSDQSLHIKIENFFEARDRTFYWLCWRMCHFLRTPSGFP